MGPTRSISSLASPACSPTLTLVVIVLALAAPLAAAQDSHWIRQLGTTSLDSALAAAPDGAAGLYVGGATHRSLAGPNVGQADAWLARYDYGGNPMWIRQFGTTASDPLFAAAPDDSGGVFVGGGTFGSLGGSQAGQGDAWVAHYDGAGSQVWLRQLGTPEKDWVYSAATDGSGGVYVAGNTEGSLGGPNASPYWKTLDVWLARYDGVGNQLWILQFGTYDDEYAPQVVPDGTGGVFVAGLSSWNSWMARFDGSGNRQWFRYLGPKLGVLGAASDGAGGLYLVGSTGASVVEANAWVARFDGAGSRVWLRKLGSYIVEVATVAAADGMGGVHVGGHHRVPLPAGKYQSQVWLAHFDRGGNQRSVLRFGTDTDDEPRAAAQDGLGGVFLAGITEGSLGGPNVGGQDAWFAHWCSPVVSYCTAKVNSAGCTPVISAQGMASTTAGSGFLVQASNVLDNKFGLFFYSTSGQQAAPFQGGFLCAKTPLVRTALQNSGGTPPCGGTFSLDFNAHIASGADPQLVAGTAVDGQYWSRDPGFPPPDHSSLTAGLHFVICP